MKAALTLALALGALTAFGQTWESAYDQAVAAAKAGNWAEARTAFDQAKALRAEDSNKPTRLPGPVTEPRFWNKGALYSANFGAAYASYRMGAASTSNEEKTSLFQTAKSELVALVSNGQASAVAVGVLKTLNAALGTTDESVPEPNNWAVDVSFVVAKDLPKGVKPPTQANQGSGNQGGNVPAGVVNTSANGTIISVKAGTQDNYEEILGSTEVEKREDKFAIVVGNSAGKLSDLGLSSGPDDADAVTAGLQADAGYKAENIVTLKNAKASEFRTAAQELAARLPNDATVLIYFSGTATHLAGKDYYIGADAESPTDTTKMVEKFAIIKPLLDKGAKIFTFSQCNRPIVGGSYFGQERILAGKVSEAHATTPGGIVNSIVVGGKRVGLYTDAFVRVLKKFHTGKVPVTEFCWQVFYTIRRGSDATGAGGSSQTPTLPVIINMSDTSDF